MALPDPIPRREIILDVTSSTLVYEIPFPFIFDMDVEVAVSTAAVPNTFSRLTYPTGYTLTGAGAPIGGEVHLAAAPQVGAKVRLRGISAENASEEIVRGIRYNYLTIENALLRISWGLQEADRDNEALGDRVDDLAEEVAGVIGAVADAVTVAAKAAEDAAASAAAAADSAAVAGAGAVAFDTLAAVTTATIAASFMCLSTRGYATIGDGKGNTYVRTAGNHAWRNTATSADGATWYESGDLVRPTSVTIPSDIGTLSELFAYLAPRRIRAPLSVTIEAGAITEPAPVVVDHPDAINISISGNYAAATVASVGTITSNSAYSHDVVLNLADASGVAVGDWLFILAGTIPTVASRWLEGSWRIIAKSGNQVTVRVTHSGASLTAIADTNFGCEVQKSVIRWDSEVNSGLVVQGVSLGTVSHVVLDGQFDVVAAGSDAAGHGVSVCGWVHSVAGLDGDVQIGAGSCTLRYASIVRWKGNGALVIGGGTLDDTYSNLCSNGWRGDQSGDSASSVFGKSCVLSGNRKTGTSAEAGGSYIHNNSSIFGNGEQGAYLIGGGAGYVTGASIGLNAAGGLHVKEAGVLTATSANLMSNGLYGAIAEGAGAIIGIDGITTAGHTTAPLRALFGGTVLARTTAPTIAEATTYSIDSNFPGEITITGQYGTVRSLPINSPTAPNGGAVLQATSVGALIIGQRGDGATSAVTSLAQFDATQFRPVTDNLYDLGRAANRWKTIYAGTGSINTSDERAKQDIVALSEAEKRVAAACKYLIRRYRFKDAVVSKGDNARLHFGVIAQEVAAAFAAEGLDATRYGLFCYDEWPEHPEIVNDHGEVVEPYLPAGSRYAIRYEELLCFILAAT